MNRAFAFLAVLAALFSINLQADSPTAFRLLDKLLKKLPPTTFPKSHGSDTADIINVIVFGTRDQLELAFERSGWAVATRLGAKSALLEVFHSLKKSSYPTGPVSSQYLFHKKQDIAFELEEGNATKRHHIRFWQAPGSPDIWVGAASEDVGLLIKPIRGVISHLVNSNLDEEREFVVKAIVSKACGKIISEARLAQAKMSARTAQGTQVFTDGQITEVSLEDCPLESREPETDANEPADLEVPPSPNVPPCNPDIASCPT